jgi:NAD(P)H-dependent FMN reductase
VTPEYNYTMPPALLNALDHLYHEWSYKACAFVSYGGVSAGTRSVQTAKLMATGFKMVPIVEAVNIPFFSQLMENGIFKSNETADKAVPVMLDELLRWTDALKVLRNS